MLLVVCNDFALVLPMIYEFIGLPSIQEVSLVEPESMGQDPISCFCCVRQLDIQVHLPGHDYGMPQVTSVDPNLHAECQGAAVGNIFQFLVKPNHCPW